jgi:hypothetical protein
MSPPLKEWLQTKARVRLNYNIHLMDRW